MESVFEILFQFVGEILLQVVFEFLAEWGMHSLQHPSKRRGNAFTAVIGFVFWGALAGGLSLLLFPTSHISHIAYRRANLIVTPLIAGGVMMLVGRLRDRRGSALVRLDRFGYAFIFAFSMAVVRYIWAV